MPYRDKSRHNQRRRVKRKEESVKRVCDRCGHQAYLLTLTDIKKMKPAQLKKLEAACLNCLLDNQL